MKPFLAALAVLMLFLADGCSSTRRTSGPVLPSPPPPPAQPPVEAAVPAAEAPPVATAPAMTTPAPTPAPGGTLALADGMERVSDADLEGSLERWADGKDIDLKHVVKRTAVFLEVAPQIKWDDNKKRERNAADHDRLVRESIAKARELVAVAEAGKVDQVRPLSDQLLQLCVDCHTSYK